MSRCERSFIGPEALQRVLTIIVVAGVSVLAVAGRSWATPEAESAATADPSEVPKIPIRETLGGIAEEAGYEIEVIGRLPDIVPAAAGADSGTVQTRFKAILNKSGVTGYALAVDDIEKQITLVVTEQTWKEPVTRYRPAATERVKRDEDRNLTVSPPSPNGEPGMTRADLRALKTEHRRYLSNLPDDTVVSPPSGHGRGLTLGELKRMKREHRKSMQETDGNAIVSPSSEHGPGINLNGLRNLKVARKKESPYSASEATAPGNETGEQIESKKLR